jgi:hypothetical protein
MVGALKEIVSNLPVLIVRADSSRMRNTHAVVMREDAKRNDSCPKGFWLSTVFELHSNQNNFFFLSRETGLQAEMALAP